MKRRTVARPFGKDVVLKFAVEIFNLAELDSWFGGTALAVCNRRELQNGSEMVKVTTLNFKSIPLRCGRPSWVPLTS